MNGINKQIGEVHMFHEICIKVINKNPPSSSPSPGPRMSITMFNLSLDDQTQVDSKPAGQPEHASTSVN